MNIMTTFCIWSAISEPERCSVTLWSKLCLMQFYYWCSPLTNKEPPIVKSLGCLLPFTFPVSLCSWTPCALYTMQIYLFSASLHDNYCTMHIWGWGPRHHCLVCWCSSTPSFTISRTKHSENYVIHLIIQKYITYCLYSVNLGLCDCVGFSQIIRIIIRKMPCRLYGGSGLSM